MQLTDWLPPDFSAVSQYAIRIGEEEASRGAHVTIVGLSSTTARSEHRTCREGTLSLLSLARPRYDRRNWSRRLIWSLATNFALLRFAWPYLRKADIVRFTGSPPFMLHFVSVANLVLRKKLVYRITDFYPECIIAALGRPSRALSLILGLTNVLRRRVHAFEVLGDDMRDRLVACGVDAKRITLRRDTSPVVVTPESEPLPRPPELRGKMALLYSGNWGVAHDIDTFFEGYKRHHRRGSGSVVLWLNATGAGADDMERRLRAEGLPVHRQQLVPLEQLAGLLVSADAHLITLRAEFTGFVLPSKVYGCIDSARPILFVGPEASDVHQLCSRERGLFYRRVDIGDAGGVEASLEALAGRKDREPSSRPACSLKRQRQSA